VLKSKRKAAVRRDLLAGFTHYESLAAKHNVSVPTIAKYIKEIQNEMRARYADQLPAQKNMMEERLMETFSQAETSYLLSKQPVEEISTQYVRVKCRYCKGTGWEDADEDSGEWCDACGGDGRVIEEQITRKVKGQAGDSSFLMVKLQAMREWNKLHGNYPEKKKDAASEQHLHLHQASQIDLSRASPESLLEALSAMNRVKLEMRERPLIEVKDPE